VGQARIEPPRVKKMAARVLFLGTPDFAVPCLQALAREHTVVAAVTRPDRPRGRGMRELPSAVKAESQRLGVLCLTPPRVSTPDFCAKLAGLEPDFLVVAAFGEILRKQVLDVPRLAPINVHASLLPKLRGAAPINWAIIRGEIVTGITTFVMDQGMDTGGILLQREIAIGPRETAGELALKLSTMAADVLLETLRGMVCKTLVPRSQDASCATYAPKLAKGGGTIDWRMTVDALDRFIRGVTPWPGAQTSFRGIRLKIIRARPGRFLPSQAEPGLLMELTPEGLEVGTGGTGTILVEHLQPATRKAMDARSFAAGYRPSAGERFGS
jgi:methionyl-tRNA formyltransferase